MQKRPTPRKIPMLQKEFSVETFKQHKLKLYAKPNEAYKEKVSEINRDRDSWPRKVWRFLFVDWILSFGRKKMCVFVDEPIILDRNMKIFQSELN